MSDWWGRYVGLPFGDGPGQVHCWELVRRVFAGERGIELPGYGIDYRNLLAVHRGMALAQDGAGWVPVSVPQAFDVAVLRHPRSARVGHVGVMVDGARLLHVEAATASVVVSIAHFSVAARIAGFRRWRE